MLHCKSRVSDSAPDKRSIHNQSFNKTVMRSLYDTIAVRLCRSTRGIDAQINKNCLVKKAFREHERLPREDCAEHFFYIRNKLYLCVRQFFDSCPRSYNLLLSNNILHQTLHLIILDKTVNVKKRCIFSCKVKMPFDNIKTFLCAQFFSYNTNVFIIIFRKPQGKTPLVLFSSFY